MFLSTATRKPSVMLIISVPGAAVYAAAGGKFRGNDNNGANKRVGTCLAVGTREGAIYDGSETPDYFAGDGASGTGAYYIINLDL